MVQRSGDGRFSGLKSSKNLPTFRNAGREDRLCIEQDHPEYPIQEEGQS